jgi:hypothetical protein
LPVDEFYNEPEYDADILIGLFDDLNSEVVELCKTSRKMYG